MRLWLSKLCGDISIWWAYSAPLGTRGLRWKPKHGGDQPPCPQVFLWNLYLRKISTCKFIYLHKKSNLADPFSDSLHNSFLDHSTLKLENKNCGYLLKLRFACTTFSQAKGLHISNKALISEMYCL